jgi:FlaA1/EpsC-like NDP-sugar epimerase
VGKVDDDSRKNGMQIGDHRVLGKTEEIPELVDTQDVSIIIFAITELAEEVRLRILDFCRQTKVRLIFLPDVVHSIQSRFTAPFEYSIAPEPLASQIDEELQELSVLFQNSQIGEAQLKIHALQKEFARAQAASNS